MLCDAMADTTVISKLEGYRFTWNVVCIIRVGIQGMNHLFCFRFAIVRQLLHKVQTNGTLPFVLCFFCSRKHRPLLLLPGVPGSTLYQ